MRAEHATRGLNSLYLVTAQECPHGYGWHAVLTPKKRQPVAIVNVMAQSMEAFRQEELDDMVTTARINGWQIDKLTEPPISFPGCDDPKGKFDWFKVVGADGKLIGHFHTEKGLFA